MWKFFRCMQNRGARTTLVAFVQNQKGLHLVRTDPGKGIVTDRDMFVHMRVGCIDRDEQKIGLGRNGQSGAEGSDKSMRQIPDESDGIGEQHLFAGREIRQAGFGVERREQPVVHIGIRAGEDVQQGRFSRVRVADERYERIIPLLLPSGFAPFDIRKLGSQIRDPPAERLVAQLEVTLAGTAHAGAAFETLLGFHDGNPRQLEFRLGQFHLNLRLGGTGTAGKDFENDLATVHDAHAEFLGQIVGLHGIQFVVENDAAGSGGFLQQPQIRSLALAEEGASVRLGSALRHLPEHADSGGIRQTRKFDERIGGFVRFHPSVDELGENGRLNLFGIVDFQ